MSGFKIVGTDCLVCKGARKKRDCRVSLSTGLNHCRHSEANPGDRWRYVGEDALGFGMWAWGEGKERRGDRPLRAASKPAKAPIAIPIEGRDTGYRALIGRVGLSQKHRAEIAKRPHVTQGEIDALVAEHHLFTWQGGEAVPPEARALPGVINGRLKNRSYSWAIAIPDHTGQILGVQVKGIKGGYQWASCDEARVHLPSGELPLGFYGTPTGDGVANVGEGYFKNALAAQRHGGVHLGMSGGNWAGAPQQLRAALDVVGCQQVVLNPDGGAVQNRHVMGAYGRLATLLDSWGIPLLVRWWGQRETIGDVDEITPEQYQTAQLLPWDEFEALAAGSDRPQRPTALARTAAQKAESPHWALNRIIRVLRPAKGIKPKKRSSSGFQSALPAPETRCTALARFEDLIVPSLLVKDPKEIPPFENWRRMGRPELLFHRGQRRAVWDRLIVLGYPAVLDEGPTGDGKTWDASEYLHDWRNYRTAAQWEIAGFSPEDILAFAASEDGLPPEVQENRAYYYSAHYRKPSNTLLESIPEAVTGGGLVLDYDDPLPSGAPSRRRPRRNEQPDIEALCVEDINIQLLRSKGVDVHRGQGSPICENCPMLQGCAYLKAKKEQATEPALRAHLSQGGKGVVAFVDEASRSIETEADITVTEQALTSELGRLNLDSATRGAIAQMSSVLVQGIVYAMAERGYWGMSHKDVLKFLPSAAELRAEIAEIEEGLRRSVPLEADLWESPPATLERELSRVGSHDLEALFSGFEALGAKNRPSPEAKGQLIDDVMQAGAIRRIVSAVLTGEEALSITPNGRLKIKRATSHQRRVLRNFSTVILLDATPDRAELASQMRIPARDIVTIKPLETGDYSNLTFVAWEGIGRAGCQREDRGQHSLQQRLELFSAHLAANATDPERVGLIDNKAFVEAGNYEALASAFGTVLGYNHRDHQNTNKFESCTTLIAINPKPRINLNEAKSTWQVRHGSTKGAAAWVERLAQTHLVQVGGRARAQHRSEAITVHLVGSEISTSDVFALQRQYSGCKIERRHVYEVCPEAAPQGYRTRRRLLETLAAHAKAGRKANTLQVASEVGVSKGRISQIAKEAGGFSRLVSLLESLYRETKPPSDYAPDIDSQLKWVSEFLPEIVERYRSGQISEVEALDAVEDALELASGWGLWLSDRAHGALNELLIVLAPDWAIPLMAPPDPARPNLQTA